MKRNDKILSAKRGEKHIHKGEFGRDMLKVLGIGLAAGALLIGTADKVGKKALEHYEDDVEFDD